MQLKCGHKADGWRWVGMGSRKLANVMCEQWVSVWNRSGIGQKHATGVELGGMKRWNVMCHVLEQPREWITLMQMKSEAHAMSPETSPSGTQAHAVFPTQPSCLPMGMDYAGCIQCSELFVQNSCQCHPHCKRKWLDASHQRNLLNTNKLSEALCLCKRKEIQTLTQWTNP
jgi:hypothetical protein